MGNNDKVQVYEDQTGNKTMHKKKIDIFNVFFRCKIFNVFQFNKNIFGVFKEKNQMRKSVRNREREKQNDKGRD